jgi:hypothetical protein
MDTVKKKRGRKPKNFYNESIDQPVEVQTEKKKRGRKKKYEIENSERILNRNEINNFNHSIVYSDDEESKGSITPEEKTVKKIAFGNLDITVSKKATASVDCYRNDMLEKTKNTKNITLINESEWDSDEEKEIPIENILNLNQENFEKYYKENKKYVPGNVQDFQEKSNSDSLKRIRVVTTVKNITDFSEWPEKTDIHCWWCCHQFDCAPCTLPTKYDQLRKRFTFVGVFCSWNCTKSYNFDRNDHLKYERSQLITLLVQQMYGITAAITIKQAPSRQCLKMFGGYMTIDEFRDKNSIVESYRMNLLSFNFVYPEITEVVNVKVKNQPKNLRLSRKE